MVGREAAEVDVVSLGSVASGAVVAPDAIAALSSARAPPRPTWHLAEAGGPTDSLRLAPLLQMAGDLVEDVGSTIGMRGSALRSAWREFPYIRHRGADHEARSEMATHRKRKQPRVSA